MNGVLLTILMFLPPALCVVDCRTACKECQENDQEHPEILEVYCSMCQECIEHRRERKLRDNFERQQIIYNLEGHEDCPPPPLCEPELDNVPPHTTPHKLLSPTIITTTKTTTTTTTTKATTTTTTGRPCPPAPPCVNRRPVPIPSPCYPCMPMCPCPYPQLFTTPASQPLAQTAVSTTTTTKTTGYLYLYVGVPKDILDKALPFRTL